MISSEISKRINESLSKLRAETEPTVDLDSVTYHASYNNTCTQEHINPNQMLLDMWEQNSCYGKVGASHTSDPEDVSSVACQDFYQEIAQAAKDWTDKPSDRRKIIEALEYVLHTAERAPEINNKLADRLKHQDYMRIINKLVNYIK